MPLSSSFSHSTVTSASVRTTMRHLPPGNYAPIIVQTLHSIIAAAYLPDGDGNLLSKTARSPRSCPTLGSRFSIVRRAGYTVGRGAA
jgi:hypothetical protein